MNVYADTNFLTRLYLQRPETAEAERLLFRARADRLGHLPITWLLRIETINALEQYVFISRTAGRSRVTAEQAASGQANFAHDLREGAFLSMIEVPFGDLLSRSEDMARRHTAKYGFRTYDLFHVASALLLGCDVLWSFDERARHLATLEGLATN